MRAPALLFTGALLLAAIAAASPARADFFKDLGDALNQLGNAVDEALTPKPAQPAPAPPPAAPPGPIDWNPAPVTSITGAQPYAPVMTRLPPPLPASRRAQLAAAPRTESATAALNMQSLSHITTTTAPAPAAAAPAPPVAPNSPLALVMANRRGPAQVDDAPPPSRAPRRAAVMASAIAPLPGFAQAPPRAPAIYSPALSASTLNRPAAPAPKPAPETTAPSVVAAAPPAAPTPEQHFAALVAPVAPSLPPPPAPVAAPALPTPRPAALAANRSFVISYDSHQATVSDALLRGSAASPPREGKRVIEALARALRQDDTQRIRLKAESLVVDQRVAEARRRAFERAQLVKEWLQAAGARSTQIDLEIVGASAQDSISLALYPP